MWQSAIAASTWNADSSGPVQDLSKDLCAFPDERGVPARAVLFVDQQEFFPRRQPAGLQELQREQRTDARQSRPRVGGQQPGQPDRFGTQLAAHDQLPGRRLVTLVEQQVEHVEYAVQPRLERLRHFDRFAGLPEPLLRPHQPLCDRGLLREQRRGDLAHAEPADDLQRQRDLRSPGQRGMAAEEHQGQFAIVRLGRIAGEQRKLRAQTPFTAKDIECPVARDPEEPAAGVGRHAGNRPDAQRQFDGVRQAVFGEVQPVRAETPGQRGEDRSRALPEQPLDHPGRRHRRCDLAGVLVGERDLVQHEPADPVLGDRVLEKQLRRFVEIVRLNDDVARDHLARLRERPIRDAAGVHDPRVRRQPGGGDQAPGGPQLLLPGEVPVDPAGDQLRIRLERLRREHHESGESRHVHSSIRDDNGP